MSDRTDPTTSIKDYTGSGKDTGVIDLGDRAKTYVFSDEEGSPSAIKVIGKSKGRDGEDSGARDALKDIAKTNDGRTNWGEANNGDGGSRNKIELFDDEGNAADDFIALIAKAMAGEDGISLGSSGTTGSGSSKTNFIEIEVEGRWSTDILRFEGGFVEDALCKLALDDPSGFAETFGETNVNLQDTRETLGVYIFDDPEKSNESQFHGNSNPVGGDADALFSGSFLNEAELPNLINAALDEKYGLGDTTNLEYLGDDGDAIVIGVTNSNKGPNTDKIVLAGSDVETILDAYVPEGFSVGGSLNTQDKGIQKVVYDTDDQTNGNIFLGGKAETVNVDGTNDLKDVVGNGITQQETNLNQKAKDDIDEFVFAVLDNQDADPLDLELIAGGEAGDDFLVVNVTGQQNTDTLILEGERIGEAIDQFAEDGTQYDFFA
ncbi:MAG: hypothetical protein AAF748_12640 [Pseudomonadota bacterium]